MTDRKLVGFHNFVRNNPRSDKFEIERFHHFEFYCSDATNVSRRFVWGLGMHQVAKSDLSTGRKSIKKLIFSNFGTQGNKHYASYVVQSQQLVFAFTAPYNNPDVEGSQTPHPSYHQEEARKFVGGGKDIFMTKF